MKLLDKLIQKRDYHQALATKFADLITVLQEDEDVQKMVHQGKLSVVNGAARHFAAVMAARTAPEPKPQSKTGHQSAAYKKGQSIRMKKLWKDKRALMLKATRKNGQKARVVMKARRKAALAAPVTPPATT